MVRRIHDTGDKPMTTFPIEPEINITAFAHPNEAEQAASGQSFASEDALGTLTANRPMEPLCDGL
jgi:hypothetical protein